jgi:uncharacterized protein YyaL (SSP411 family)
MTGQYAVPQKPRDAAETAARFGMKREEAEIAIAEARVRLLDVRTKRPKGQWHPLVITEHNARMVSALARSAAGWEDSRYAGAAVRGLREILRRNLRRGVLLRAEDVPALPEDFTALVGALLDTYEATFDVSLLERAVEMQRLAGRATFPALPKPVAPLFTRGRDEQEAGNLIRLATITGDSEWLKQSGRDPASHRQVIVAGDPARPETQALLRAARTSGGGDRMVFLLPSQSPPQRLAGWMPYVKEIVHPEQIPVATICQARTCRTPTADAHQLSTWLARP